MIQNRLFLYLPALILMLLVAACGGTPSPASRLPTTANAGQVVELARSSKGTILSAPAYSPDGKWLAIPGAAGIYIHDAVTLEELRRTPQGTSFIAFSPDGNILAASGRDSISLWNPSTGLLLAELPGIPGGRLWELSFSPDGSLLAASTSAGEIFVWSVSSGKRRFNFPGDSLQFSLDGELAVVNVYGEDWVYLYETGGGSEVNKWDVHRAGFAPGGHLWLETPLPSGWWIWPRVP